jgi:hypothetical protein
MPIPPPRDMPILHAEVRAPRIQVHALARAEDMPSGHRNPAGRPLGDMPNLRAHDRAQRVLVHALARAEDMPSAERRTCPVVTGTQPGVHCGTCPFFTLKAGHKGSRSTPWPERRTCQWRSYYRYLSSLTHAVTPRPAVLRNGTSGRQLLAHAHALTRILENEGLLDRLI